MNFFYSLFALIVLLGPSSYAVRADTDLSKDINIAVASNFRAPLEEIANLYTKTTSKKVVISSGSSGKFVAQIENGAPFDLFLSADQKFPRALIEKKLAEQSSRFTYAIGSLVLWSSSPELVDGEAGVLKRLNFKHLAIANPDLAPYGLAAKQTLEKMGLWEKVKSKIVMGENIEQTEQFIASGNAELGFIPLSMVKTLKGTHWLVPSENYSPILQDAVILSRSKDKPEVKKFFAFLKSKGAKGIIESYGYSLPQ